MRITTVTCLTNASYQRWLCGQRTFTRPAHIVDVSRPDGVRRSGSRVIGRLCRDQVLRSIALHGSDVIGVCYEDFVTCSSVRVRSSFHCQRRTQPHGARPVLDPRPIPALAMFVMPPLQHDQKHGAHTDNRGNESGSSGHVASMRREPPKSEGQRE